MKDTPVSKSQMAPCSCDKKLNQINSSSWWAKYKHLGQIKHGYRQVFSLLFITPLFPFCRSRSLPECWSPSCSTESWLPKEFMGTRLPELLLRAGDRGGPMGSWFLGMLYNASAKSAALFRMISCTRKNFIHSFHFSYLFSMQQT